MTKITHVTHQVSDKQKTAWDRTRWQQDGVARLPEGFTLVKRGRDGSIYFRKGERTLELYYEMSGVPDKDILVSLSGLTDWVLPERLPIPAKRQSEIRLMLQRWLEASGVRSDVQ